MPKARAIVKRRKAVRNIKKITKTMQMIATAKFQKALKRAVGTKPYTRKVRELVAELAATMDMSQVSHPLLRRVDATTQTNRVALVVITSNRGLAGAYNGSVLRTANRFIIEQSAAGKTIDLYAAGKKGVSFFNFQKRPITQRFDQFADSPKYSDVQAVGRQFIEQFTAGTLDAVYVAYMNFISTGSQKPEVMQLLPLAGVTEAAEHIAQQSAEKEAQLQAGVMDATRSGTDVKAEAHVKGTTEYEFLPDAATLLNELLPLTVQTALFQAFLDATSSENVARMVAMKSATDNADKMAKALSMQYNRARQAAITTELSEILGGVEAMKG
ncbi:MAG TPA: ATP synthase F1 subunit gamma [Tepidisphaeraceae bacterium]|jgi:F-type H+-transporting ATPase subunit gamma|nr:ATP synthase F1 subunit gamma [Tepidisphaeraceae bacterium]